MRPRSLPIVVREPDGLVRGDLLDVRLDLAAWPVGAIVVALLR
jgi:hypothetical protein